MTFASSVLKTKARHRRWLRKTKGLRAHKANLDRIRAREEEEEEEEAFKWRFPTADAFLDYMRNERGCGP